jgi:hypothetical protein
MKQEATIIDRQQYRRKTFEASFGLQRRIATGSDAALPWDFGLLSNQGTRILE